MSDLIDTTEMYLRTILELEEEGVVPLRARIAERLHQSGPTVSQTVARMERDGLVTVEGDRHLELTGAGRDRAVGVMRKHRLAELLLVNVIGLEYEAAHAEACRWEHVMSEEVEQKVWELLGRPNASPYGNRIPGLDKFGSGNEPEASEPVVSLTDAAGAGPVVVRRISEQLQKETGLIHELHEAGVAPGAAVTVSWAGGDATLTHGEISVKIPARDGRTGLRLRPLRRGAAAPLAGRPARAGAAPPAACRPASGARWPAPGARRRDKTDLRGIPCLRRASVATIVPQVRFVCGRAGLATRVAVARRRRPDCGANGAARAGCMPRNHRKPDFG